jgi:hypothetical protein
LVVAESKYETGIKALGLNSRFNRNRFFSTFRAKEDLDIWAILLAVLALVIGLAAWMLPDFWKHYFNSQP